MTSIDTKLMHPRQHLGRANKQLKALNKADRRFAGSQAYQLGKSTVTEDGEDYGIIYVDSCKPIPDDIPLLVGDICNCLRSALDNMLWRVWLKKDPSFGNPGSFPICDTASCFEITAPKYIGGLPQAQQAMFESVQPYNRENPYLSILRDLNNADQQRLNSVISTTSIIDQVKLKGMISPSGKFRFIADRSTPPVMEVSTELLRVTLGEFVGDIDVDRKFKYWQVFGSFPKIAQGLAVVSTLSAIKDEVKRVLDQFSPFLRP